MIINKKPFILAFCLLFFLFSAISAKAEYGVSEKLRQVKVEGDAGVFYLDHGRGLKKKYVNEKSFLCYGNKWSDVVAISREELARWPDVRLIKKASSPIVYYIQDGKKTPIKNEADFKKYGFSWDEIMTVKEEDFEQYADSSYDSMYLQNCRLLKLAKDPVIYCVKGDKRVDIKTEKDFNEFNLNWNDIQEVSIKEMDGLKWATYEEMNLRQPKRKIENPYYSDMSYYPNRNFQNTFWIKGQKGVKIASFSLEISAKDSVLVNKVVIGPGRSGDILKGSNGFSNLVFKINGVDIGKVGEIKKKEITMSGFEYLAKAGGSFLIEVFADTEKGLKVDAIDLMLVKVEAVNKSNGKAARCSTKDVLSYPATFGNTKVRVDSIKGGEVKVGKLDYNLVSSFLIKNDGDEPVTVSEVRVNSSGKAFSNSLGFYNLGFLDHLTKAKLGSVLSKPVAGQNILKIQKRIEASSTLMIDLVVSASENVIDDDFEVYLDGITAKGINSKLEVDISGLPTKRMYVDVYSKK